MIILKTDREIGIMREANRIIAVVLNEIGERIRPGISTTELDHWAEERIVRMRAQPAFKGYGGTSQRSPFPATLCTSLNSEVVHGIPSPQQVLREGDIISIDVGVLYEGFYGDGAYSYPVGAVSDTAKKLLATCQHALALGVEQALAGNRLSAISLAVEQTVRAEGFEIVRDLSGHGIGRNLHEEPQILNFFDGRKGPKLKTNMTLAIEPMITAGGWQVRTRDDGWTVVTADGSLAAHFEHTVAVSDNGPEILTRV